MKYCPTCQQCYEDAFSHCNRDQMELVEAPAGARLVAHKYSLDRLLNQTRADVVYAGRHLETDRPVVMRIYLPPRAASPEQIRSLRHEVHVVAHLNTRIDHPHVARTYDYGMLPDGAPYVVTEMVAGRSLREQLEEAGPLPVDLAIRLARQMAEGLWAAHRRGVPHLHLDPSKVLLSPVHDGQVEVKIIDFGLLKLRSRFPPEEGGETDTQLASRYLAPEVRDGAAEADGHADVYSLGVIFFEMLAGHTRFEDSGDVHERAGEDVSRLVRECLCEKPSGRPNTASDIALSLRSVERAMKAEASAAVVRDEVVRVEEAAPSETLAPTGPLPGPDRLEGAPAMFADGVIPAARRDSDEGVAVTARLAPERELTEEARPRQPETAILAAEATDEKRPPAPAVTERFPGPAAPRPRPVLGYAVALAVLILAGVGGLWLLTLSARQEPSQQLRAEALRADQPLPAAESDAALRPESDTAGQFVADERPLQSPPPETPTRTAAVNANTRPPVAVPTPAPRPTPESRPGNPAQGQASPGQCNIALSQNQVVLRGGETTVVRVRAEDSGKPLPVTASTPDWANVVFFPEPQTGSAASFSIVSVGRKEGTFKVTFRSPCGSRDLAVTVKKRGE